MHVIAYEFNFKPKQLEYAVSSIGVMEDSPLCMFAIRGFAPLIRGFAPFQIIAFGGCHILFKLKQYSNYEKNNINALTAAAKHDYKNRSTESMKGHQIQISKFKFKLTMITEECDNSVHHFF